MTDGESLDRRKHHGPWRILYMDLSLFMKRFFGRGNTRR
jgi:hypothetical protein